MFAEPFDLLKFPKISGNSYSNVPVSISNDLLFIGVSGSSVNKLRIVPPQVLSAHSVSPDTQITAILANDDELVAYATKERGKYFLNVFGEELKTTEVSEEVAAIYISRTKNVIATVGKTTSTIRSYQIDDLQNVDEGKGTERGTTIYSSQLDGTDETVFTQLLTLKNSVLLKTQQVTPNGVKCLQTVTIEGGDANAFYSQYNTLLYSVSKGKVSVYDILTGLTTIQFELENSEVDGLMALPHNNIAISRHNVIELVDCSYQSQISTAKLMGKNTVKILGYSNSSSTLILMNKEKLVGLSVTPSTGTLLESIGKKNKTKQNKFPLVNIFGEFSFNDNDELVSNYKHQLNKSIEENRKVLADLKTAIKNGDGAFFAKVVTYLKSPKLSWISDLESIECPSEQDLVFEESDRVADVELIKEICKMAFIPKFKPFIPIGVASYLLTHPLFPITEPEFRKMLKNMEKSDNILYRQSLVSLTGLTVEDLVMGLLSLDEGTFVDAATRLQEDFGTQQILTGIRKAFKGVQSISSLAVLIERLSQYPESIGLIGPFIDAVGLLAWDVEHINALKSRIKDTIAATESLALTDSAITNLFDSIGVEPSESTIPPANELQLRSQKKHNLTKDAVIPKYSVDTLIL